MEYYLQVLYILYILLLFKIYRSCIKGNSTDGTRLLQKYLDITGDIQSTTLIAVRAFSTNLDIVKDWISW